MKKLLYLISWMPAISMAQVGINAPAPSAALDIISKNNTNLTQALLINDNTHSPIMNVADNGNVYFKGSLSTNGNAGTDDLVLKSNGTNSSPQWTQSGLTSLDNYVLLAYNGYSNTATSYFVANAVERLNFTNANITSSDVGTWNTTTKEYTVAKSGIFDVVVNTEISTQTDNASRTSEIFLQMGTYKQGSIGHRVVGSLRNSHLSTKASRYLTAGEKIYITVKSTINWRFDKVSININYSEKTF